MRLITKRFFYKYFIESSYTKGQTSKTTLLKAITGGSKLILLLAAAAGMTALATQADGATLITTPDNENNSLNMTEDIQVIRSDESRQHGKKVIGYFIEWGVYARNYLVKDIPVDKLTHLNFAFIAPFILEGKYTLFDSIDKKDFKKSDGSNPTTSMYIVGVEHCTISNIVYSTGLAVDDTWACFEKTNYDRRYNETPAYGWRKNEIYGSWDKPAVGGVSGPGDRTAGIFGELTGMKKAHPHIKNLAAIGGWSYSYYFSDIAAHETSRQAFAKACRQMLDVFGARDNIPTLFDGLDMDWEFPYEGGDSAVIHRPDDKDNLTALCQSLREQIGTDKLLTIATAQNYRNIANQYDPALEEHLDFICIMAYDYCGSWSPRTGAQAPLYGGNTNDPLYNTNDKKYMVISEVVSTFLKEGFKASKIMLGLPFYGRSFDKVNNENNGLYQPFSGAGPGSYDAGTLEFNDIVDDTQGNRMLSRVDGEWVGVNGYTRYWDEHSRTPYLFNGSRMVSYDDDISLTVKTRFAMEQGLGGVMIWELSSDTQLNSETPNLLINAVDAALYLPVYRQKNDFTGEGSSELVVYDETSGTWHVRLSDGSILSSQFGGSDYTPISGDYDGDGIADLAIYNEIDGIWKFLLSATGYTNITILPFGGEDYKPVPGDYDGDGQDDIAVYHNGLWFAQSLNGTLILNGEAFGGADFTPITGDFNGDGKTDLTVYHQATGNWYCRTVAGEILMWETQWGGPNLLPLTGDFNGDGYSDLAVYKDGYWYIWSIANGLILWATQWGGPDFTPVPVDYNGDGRMDLAVYHEQSGKWFVIATDGSLILWDAQMGGAGYKPVK